MNWIYTQIKYLQDFVPIILADDKSKLEGCPEYPITSIENPIHRSFIRYLRIIGVRIFPSEVDTVIREQRPKLVHSHFGDRGWYDLPLVEKYHLKQVVTFYGYDLSLLPVKRPIWKNRYKQLFQRADLFLCEGPFMAKSLIDLGCPPEKVQVQSLGIDLEDIAFKPRRIINNGKIKILIVGRFIEKKGIPYALEAVGKIKDQFHHLEVTIIGDSTGTRREEIEKARIFKAIHDHGLEKVTRNLGFQPFDVMIDLAYKHHIFLSPSVRASDGDAEGGVPVTIIEMLASGMPVISTDHCDIPGVVTDGVSGFLAPERDADSLADHLAWIIEHQDKWEEMAQAGRSHIEKNFNAKIQGEKLMEIYQKLCS